MFSQYIKIFFLIYIITCPLYAADQIDYQISSEDVIEISVYDENNLSRTVRVSPNGFITYPLLGRISVQGLTVHQLENKITELLEKDFLVNPQVNVFVKEFSNVYILGEVRNPGPYKLTTQTTVMKIIALAGGFKEFADNNNIEIIREKNSEKRVINISLSNILHENVLLKQNDIVRVNRLKNIYIIGQVKKPGEYILKGELNVVEAITLAGGLTKIAAPNKIKVIRSINGKKKTFIIPVAHILKSGDLDKDITLLANDVIMVPESFF